MKVRPEVSTAQIETFADNRIPIVTTTEAETTVIVKSGVTIIIGGLIETSDEETINKLPLLSDIPYLGKAFQSTVTDISRSELVVFLTPTITHPDGSVAVFPAENDYDHEGLSKDRPLPLQYRATVRQMLQDQVYADLQKEGLKAGTAVLSFVLDARGAIKQVEEVSSPQGEFFAAVVEDALYEVAPFPPFPHAAPAQEVRFRVEIEYTPSAAVVNTLEEQQL
jgi:hypothetical protein